MEKNKHTKFLLFAAPITLLLLIPLLASDFCGGTINAFDQWLQSSRLVRGLNKEVEQQESFKSLLARLVRGEDQRKLETTGFACDVAENSLVCLANKRVTIDTRNNVTVHDSSTQAVKETIVRPYALQKDTDTLEYITPVKTLHGETKPQPPLCEFNHEVLAVIFSSVVTGNLFHEFNDIIIPLFITIKHFKSRVLVVLEDFRPSFVAKYSKILRTLSSYEVMDPAVNRSVHCFPGMIVGLKCHDNLALKPNEIPGGYSMRDFRQFLAEAYSLRFRHVSQIKKPTLMLLSREKSRMFLNEDEIVATMEEIGFRVIVARTNDSKNLNEFANVVNSCSVLMGVHGAGLTNELFLPNGGVMVQVEPLGLEWAAAKYYGDPARAMGVRYLRYKIEADESSLVELYGRDHAFVTDPALVYAKGYKLVRAVYLNQQSVRINNVVRLRETLVQALQLIRKNHVKQL